MVERGLVPGQEQARALIMAGDVRVGDRPLTKPGLMVPEDVDITLKQRPLFVSRGGIKLACALDSFGLSVVGFVAADIGASTGGFTDCLLQRGASRVYAIDVGRGQLDEKLRHDPRVIVMEEVNARYPISLPEKVDLATIDVSFISVEKVIPSVATLVKGGGHFVVLLKPQFEAERREVRRGGLVTDSLVHVRVLGRFITWAIDHGLRLKGLVASPILGASGNREFLVYLRLPDEAN